MSYFEPEAEVSSSSGREVMFSDCDTVDRRRGRNRRGRGSCRVRCATGWVGRHRSMEGVIPKSLTDARQGYQGPIDERRWITSELK